MSAEIKYILLEAIEFYLLFLDDSESSSIIHIETMTSKV